MAAQLREYRPGDLDALYEICLKTGDAGADASALHAHPQLTGSIYAAPYGVFEPEHVILAEDETGVAGYIVGTYDTMAFATRLERDWWPDWRKRFPLPAAQPGRMDADAGRIATIHDPQTAPADIVAQYPAHIHMNLLPRLQGQGMGTALLETWIERARAAEVSGIHLGASLDNHRGMAFWQSRGFAPLRRDDGAQWFGMQI